MRLDIPNGIASRLSPDGLGLTCGNDVCTFASLRRDGAGVVVDTVRDLSDRSQGQAYAGYWEANDYMRWWQDQEQGRVWYRFNRNISQNGPATVSLNTAFYSRDWLTVEETPDGIRINRNILEPTDIWTEGGFLKNPQCCEGFVAGTVPDNNAIVVRRPDGVKVTVSVPSFIRGWTLGPDGEVIIADFTRLWCWSAKDGLETDVQIQPIVPGSFTWGEALGWCWRRPDGTIWLVTTALNEATSKCYALIRPLGSVTSIWREVEIQDGMTVGESDGHFIAVGSNLANAYGMAVPVNAPLRAFTPDVPPIDPPPPDQEEPVEDAALLAALKNINDRLDAIAAVQLTHTNRLADLDADVNNIHARCVKLEELARAARAGTVGSVFGTQPLTLKPNVTP